MKKDEALTKINESDSDDFQVFTKPEHETFLTNYKETEVSKKNKEDILRVHSQYEEDIKSILGTEKNSDEKTYDFLKRQLKSLKSDIEGRDAKISDLDKAVNDKSGDEALKLAKSDLDAFKQKHQKTLDEFKAERESQQMEVHKIKMANQVDHSLMGVKFLASIPEDARNAMVEVAKRDVIQTASFLDGKAIFLDANGDPERDDNYNVVTVEMKMKGKLKSIIDEGRTQTGVKIEDPDVKKNEDGELVANISVPETVKDMNGLIEHLKLVGIKRNSPEYYPTLKKYSEQLGIN